MQLANGKFIGRAVGFGGIIELEVEILDFKIQGIEILSHNETKIISDPAFKYVPSNIVDLSSIFVPNVSGASITSRAIKNATIDALVQAGANRDYLESQMIEAETLEKICEHQNVTLPSEVDIIVVGSGGAGLSAAISAAENGRSVLLIEKMNTLGGNTLVSMGGVNIPMSDAQLASNIEDSNDSFYEDIVAGGDNENILEQVDILVANAFDTYKWIKDFVGVNFKPTSMMHFGGHKVPRATVFEGKYAIELISKLRVKAQELGVRIVSGVKAKNLLVDEGKVRGIEVSYNEGICANIKTTKGVVLATGGFSSNVEMRMQYDKNLDTRYKTTNVSGVTGEGHIMAKEAGAKFVHMEHIQTFPISNPHTGELSHIGGARFDGAILVNKQGERFVEELDRRDVVSEGILNQIGNIAYLVWSDEIESINNSIKNNKPELDRLNSDDLFMQADTVEEAAKFMGINTQTLQHTIDKYNKFVENGHDEDFNRRGSLVPIKQAPFYIQAVAPAVHHTMGGVAINSDMQVLDMNDKPIEGLYAAGEIVGGTHGTNRLGGNAITEILVFGKIAGQKISQQ
ncbi:MAG: hypothetical protein ATN35_11230 [Epulopiscium sp. Nele67-Bin004]|nr:MAG: hypothetical protein ATN35_11230 [Epulopiscium sp. Nele67-Bin004]